MSLLAVAFAGGIGAALRYVTDSLLPKENFPTGTLVVNVIGSFILGLCTGLQLGGALSNTWLTILGTGFAGGFTTLSTASLDAFTLLKENQAKKAHLYVWSMLFLCLVASYLAILLGFNLA
ncbi:fluoride efflux transporter CrcB [Arcanobacterium ihumii]|uniref:fluoride efflux transporter CrcB n=1 Tax=Arcanobacterium ihumii TaxID=2138162 RepID=UPI000F51D7B5|nr:fluoride efflux transporter CrcB [Arcanobacterium ihumii]